MSTNEIQSFLNNPKARKDSLKSIAYQDNPKLINRQMSSKANSQITSSIMVEEEGPAIETKVFMGSRQTYYFNNVSIQVSLTFAKKKSNGGWIWVASSHTVQAYKISNESDNTGNYYDGGDNTMSYDGTSCSFTQKGYLYYRGFGQTYYKEFSFSGYGGYNGTWLTITLPN